ncbi:YIP1 family protein [Cereibacter changlensis JA139]|uniref:YIP1 family protein n=2 Tax=Cereibacter changlensis TaxID=402884 RepID=A0A2T4JXA1_9RHOB|nr:YIP1 family protein [Cereibacter changlensis]PTE22373.1 YIP1 family protein [Cereibacter changlensis JA139]PZX57426.1 hypothetical protein LX76_00971 [Cereibacter changlensis]
MSVTSDIVASWRHPRKVIASHLARGRSEPFAFSLLVVFLVLAFVAQWPRLSRQSVLGPDVPLVQGMVATGLALLAMIPVFYLLAAISRGVAMLLGGKGSFYSARLALFMALLATSPLMLLHGLTLGFTGSGAQSLLVGGLAFAAFAILWIVMLIEAETWS